MDNSLKCIFINVNSIVSRHKRHYLDLFLREHRPDVLLLAEHKLSTRHTLDIGGYRTYRQDRQNERGGGTAVLVRVDLCSERLVLDLGAIECTAVRVTKADGGLYRFVSAYLRPQVLLSISDLDPILNLSSSGGFLIGMDLNAKHTYFGGDVCNRSGHNLREFLLSCPDLDIHRTAEPTRILGNSSSFLDYFMTSSDIRLSPISTNGLRTLDFESDHNAVEIVMESGNLQQRTNSPIFNFDRMNIGHFNRILARDLPDCQLPTDRNVSIQEIDDSISAMNSVFGNAMNEAIPKMPSGNRGLLQLPPNILNFISEKKRLRRTLWRTTDPTRCSVLRADIRNLDRIIQGAIALFEEDYWCNFLQKIEVNNRTFRLVKRGAGIRKRTDIPDLRDSDGILIPIDADKAELMADGFCRIHRGDDDLRSPSFVHTVEQRVSTLIHHRPVLNFGQDVLADGSIVNDYDSNLIDLISPGRICSALRTRKNKKTSNQDGIPDYVLKKTDLATWRCLSILFNHCQNIGYFPADWKMAMVVPILKPGCDPVQVGSYRPISMLSAFGKLFESFLLARINDRILDGDILHDSQFGFRVGHSTSHALTVFGDYVARGLNNRSATLVVSLDLAKAFDTAWQKGIVFKMMEYGFDQNTCRMVANFLDSRTFMVRVGTELSGARDVVAGVPQGSLLGPVLYNIFVSDLPRPPEGDLTLTYADDMLIAAKGPRASTLNNRVNDYLDVLGGYFDKWGLRLNVGKTDSVLIKGRRGRLYPNARGYIPHLSVGGESIRTSDRLKYLGVIFHENFEFYRHIDFVLEKVKKVYFLFHSLLRRRTGLSTRVRLLIYRQIIRPLMAYAFPVWFGISSHQMDRLRIWERRILSSCLGLRPTMRPNGHFRSPSCRTIYDGIDFERVDVFLIGSAIKFLERSSQLDNQLVRECFRHLPDLGTLHVSKYLSPVDLLGLRDGNLLYGDAGLLFYHRRVGTLDLDDLVYNTEQ